MLFLITTYRITSKRLEKTFIFLCVFFFRKFAYETFKLLQNRPRCGIFMVANEHAVHMMANSGIEFEAHLCNSVWVISMDNWFSNIRVRRQHSSVIYKITWHIPPPINSSTCYFSSVIMSVFLLCTTGAHTIDLTIKFVCFRINCTSDLFGFALVIAAKQTGTAVLCDIYACSYARKRMHESFVLNKSLSFDSNRIALHCVSALFLFGFLWWLWLNPYNTKITQTNFSRIHFIIPFNW